ncbi:unnamed protein product, partial [Polarella glacialis]
MTLARRVRLDLGFSRTTWNGSGFRECSSCSSQTWRMLPFRQTPSCGLQVSSLAST